MIKRIDEFNELFEQIDKVQEAQDLSCNCTECYWNLWNPSFKRPYYSSEAAKQCVSESLADFKMMPNSTECKGYWSFEEACGHKKGK